ncbi:MAG: carbohydrate ABC transporter permease [Spirochaetota bacterium]
MRNRRSPVETLILVVSVILLSTFSLVPVLWGLSTSLKTEAGIFAIPPRWIPDPLTFKHYQAIISNGTMVRYFLNTTIIAAGTTAGSLLIAILGAYGFSRFRFPGRKTLLWSILFTRLLPRVTVIIPLYIVLRNLRLLNTYAGLILVYMLIVMPLAVWLLKGFFDNLPYEIEEAAVLDGCSPLGVLTRIIVPISLPAIASVAMYSFILAWNEFLFALIMTNGKATRPIAVGLSFFIDEVGVHWGPLMAASMLMSVPAIIVFMLLQTQLIRGLSDGAVKG